MSNSVDASQDRCAKLKKADSEGFLPHNFMLLDLASNTGLQHNIEKQQNTRLLCMFSIWLNSKVFFLLTELSPYQWNLKSFSLLKSVRN